MIQDIAPHQFFNSYDPDAVPDSGSLVYCFDQGSLLIRRTPEDFFLPTVAELPEDLPLQYLFRIDDVSFFLAKDLPETVPEDYHYEPFTFLRKTAFGSMSRVFAASTALQLSGWYRDNRYCGTCGSRMVHSGRERAMLCPECGRTVYPRIVPAVIVAVLNGDKILLTRYASAPGAVTFNALVAGFTEIGETLEETVAREVMEEVGLKVKNIRYYKSQPWAFADDILVGFYCDVDGDDTIHLDTSELKTAVWTRAEDVVLQPNEFSLTNEMMKRFKEGKPC